MPRNASFSSRIALYFGALTSTAIALSVLVWYAGAPWLHLIGAQEQSLIDATSRLEASANSRLQVIQTSIAERRGDILLLVQEKPLIKALSERNLKALGLELESMRSRIELAYPDRYESLRLIDPRSGRIVASTRPDEVGVDFDAKDALAQATAPGFEELLDEVPFGERRSLAVLRQVVERDKDGYPTSGVLAIFMATLRVDSLMPGVPGGSRTGYEQGGASLVIGVDKDVLGRYPQGAHPTDEFWRNYPISGGFEGVLHLTDSTGAMQLAVYRHIQLNSEQGWTLIHFQSEQDALWGLKTQVKSVLWSSAVFALLGLLLAWLVARHLTRPLNHLSHAARLFGGGALSTRANTQRNESREFIELADAFNGMASQVERNQLDLEAKVAERTAELGINEERLRLALAAGNLGIYDINLQTGKAAVNAQYATMLGYDPDTYAPEYTNWVERLHPDDREATIQAYERYMAGDTPDYRIEFRQRARNGDWVWILSKGRIVERDQQGRPLRLTGTHSDITARKAVEDRLGLAATVFSHAREGILISDANGCIVEANDTFTAITGYTREEALGKNPHQLLDSGRQSPDFYDAMENTLLQSGSWSGEIWSRRKNGELFAELLTISAVRDKSGIVRNFVALFSDITAIKAHQSQLEHIAHFDALTGLPNRVLLADRLQYAMAQCQRRQESLGVAFLDLDGFKTVNDDHGHDVGDQLLVALAQRMKAALRDGDTLARIGGDEFVAVLVGLESTQDCEPILQRLLHAAADKVLVGDIELQVSGSVGVTIYPQDGADPDMLLRHADQAMYLAKQSGKNRYHLFDVAHDAAVKTQREMIDHVRQAMRNGEFVLFYQPKVNMRTGAIIGAEALIRWQHPDRGLLAPALFLPAIEDQPISVNLGEWVIASALQQIATWQTMGLDIPVSVNIGARQLQDAGFVNTLTTLLAAQPDVAPHLLELEVLETSGMEDIAYVSQVMRACQSIGVEFALDDFGTGYSSLTYLKRLPAECIKIDQSFVRDMLTDTDDLAIVQGVIGLAKAFRRQVIAEGVETVAHGSMLLPLGCELAQGYGIARPMPAADLPAWAAQWRPDAAWSNAP
jgi:diguanylate cyclase (GGDEF)-like protein/PAS domain S-box-containing protein